MDEGVDSLAELRAEVTALRDLFHRRLLEDKAKQKLFDELYAQLEFSRKGLTSQALEPLIREELGLLDRLERYDGDDPEFVEGVIAELWETLSRRGVEKVRVTRTFDANVQEVVGRAPTGADLAGQVVGVRRPGYLLNGKLVRPAQVVVGDADGSALFDGDAVEEDAEQPELSGETI